MITIARRWENYRLYVEVYGVCEFLLQSLCWASDLSALEIDDRQIQFLRHGEPSHLEHRVQAIRISSQ